MLYKRLEADTNELRVGVVVTFSTYNSLLESSKGFWSVPLHLHTHPTSKYIPLYLCFEKSFIHWIPGHTDWDMNECQSYRMENRVIQCQQGSKNTTARPSRPNQRNTAAVVWDTQLICQQESPWLSEKSREFRPFDELLIIQAALFGWAVQSIGWTYGAVQPV